MFTADELNWTELTGIKLTQLHDELLVTRISVTKLTELYKKIIGEWRFSETQCTIRMKHVHSATSFRKGLFLYKNIVLWEPGSYTYTHTRLTALLPGLPRWAGTRKVKPIWILLEQDKTTKSAKLMHEYWYNNTFTSVLKICIWLTGHIIFGYVYLGASTSNARAMAEK